VLTIKVPGIEALGPLKRLLSKFAQPIKELLVLLIARRQLL